MKKLKRISFVLLAFVTLSVAEGCSPQKKLQKLLQKHPELVVKDTVKFTDTLHTAIIFTDTIVQFDTTQADTINLVKEKLTVRVIAKKDSIYISGQCQGDTIYINKEIPVEKLSPCPPVKEPTFWEKIKNASVWLVMGFVAAFLFLRLR